jgi:hypothetical protein
MTPYTTHEEAALLARQYSWPEEARSLEKGIVPQGFALEVGRAIVLFKTPIPCFFPHEREATDRLNTQNKRDAQSLVRLRVLIAKMGQ